MLTPNDDPELFKIIEEVFATLRTMNTAPGVDPLVLAHLANVDKIDALAALGLLIQRAQGSFAVQVLNSRGQSVREFPSIEATPDVVADDYGDVIEVEPSNTRVVFRLAPSFFAPAA